MDLKTARIWQDVLLWGGAVVSQGHSLPMHLWILETGFKIPIQNNRQSL